MTEEEWEDICDGCGKCCAFGGTTVACPSLDCSNNRCMTYEDRLTTQICCQKVKPDNVKNLHIAGILPDSCAYVRYTYGQDPLPRPIESARLIPFMLAPFWMQEKYSKANKKWKETVRSKHDNNRISRCALGPA